MKTEKRDLKDLISAWDAILAINRQISKFTDGSCIEGGKFKDIYLIENVIQRHSRYPGDDERSIDKFCKILYSRDIPTKKKIERLLPKD